MHLLHGFRRLELENGRPEHAHANHQQDDAQRQGGCGFKPLMAIGMVFIGVLLAVVAGKQHHEVCNQV